MKFNPKVSFLIPCFNTELYLKKAIDCVINQTYKNLEIILIDDGSQDNTLEILSQYHKLDNRIVLIQNEENLGLIKSLNKGIDNASGEFIARFDSDDLIDLNRIELQIETLRMKPDIDLLTSKAIYITPQDKYHSNVDHFYCALPLSIRFVSLFECPLLHAGLIVKTSVLKKYKYNFSENTKHIEDYDLFSRIIMGNLKIQVDSSEKLLYQYRRNINSISNNNRNTQFDNTQFQSEKNLYDILNFKIDKAILEIINLKITIGCAPKQMKEAIKTLKSIRQIFFTIQKENISDQEKEEINNWVQLRIFKILLNAFLSGNLILRLGSIQSLFTNIDVIFSKFTKNYSVNRLTWLKSKLLYNV